MKTTIVLIIVFSFTCLGQTLDAKNPPVLIKFQKKNNQSISEEHYHIACTFLESITSDQFTNIKKLDNWFLLSENNKTYKVTSISKTPTPNEIYLEGDFEVVDALSVVYLGDEQQKVAVKIDPSISEITSFKIGDGKGISLALRRIAGQSPLYAVDYSAKIDILGNYFYPSNLNGFYFQSYSINLKSSGTFTNSISTVPNNTQTSLDISAIPYFNTSLLIYRNEFHLGYQVETKSGTSYFDIINKSLKVGAVLEIPYTNYPMYYLTQKNHYLRLAMPVIFKFDYLPAGTDAQGISTLSRIDLAAVYELAFSPYLIVKGEWNYSKLINPPNGTNNTNSYTAITFGQDLKVLAGYLGILKLIFGDDKIENKNFIYYKIESGSKAPDFLPVNQQSFGFGMYF